MNFYAHALVAERLHADADFILGAMLPDLAAMAGLRALGADSVPLRQGILLHHECDQEFHSCTEFVDLTRDGARDLQSLGVRRGPSRAAAHVGVELLLDGWLVEKQPPSAMYRLAVARAALCTDTVRWRTPPTDAWQRMCARLTSSEATNGYRDLDEVARRTTRTLARRPRLALAEREFAPLARWLDGVRARVAHHGPALLDAVTRLRSSRSGTPGSPLHCASPDRERST